MEECINRYCFIKNAAYNSVEFFKTLSDKQQIEFIENYPLEGIDKRLFITTLLLPNDIELLNLYKSGGLELFIKMAEEYNIPYFFLFYKATEYDSIDLMKFIAEGKISRNSAMQESIYFNKSHKANNNEQFVKLLKKGLWDYNFRKVAKKLLFYLCLIKAL